MNEESVIELQNAVQRFVEANGGKLIVVGAIEIQEWPNDLKYNFRVAVQCTGRRPTIDSPPMLAITEKPA